MPLKKAFLRKRLLPFFILAVVLSACLVFTEHDAFLYRKTVFRITKAEDVNSGNKQGTNGGAEATHLQKLTGIFLNGTHKGTQITLENQYSDSLSLSDEYKKGDTVFVSVKETDESLKVTITNKKRDTYLVLLIGLLLILLFLAAGRRAIFTALSVLVNTFVFVVGIRSFSVGLFTEVIWILSAVAFIAITLVFVSGFSKKTLACMLSSVVTAFLITMLFLAVVRFSSEMHYEMQNYVVAYMPLADIYMISTIFGSLGAIMDISVTMNSSAFEIIDTAGSVSKAELRQSLRMIGKDVMGTMVNVLFFSYISSALPLIMIHLCYGYSWSLIFDTDFGFELIRFLIGSIGIVSAIPISSGIALWMNRRTLRVS